RPVPAQRRWRRHRAGPSGRRLGRPHRAALAAGAAGTRLAARHGGYLHRRRPGRRHAGRDGGHSMNTATPHAWRHWRLERHADGLAWLTLDRADAAVNALSAEVMAEFSAVLDALQADPPQGLVIRSGKAAGFIAGADVDEFSELRTPGQARALVERGWHLFNRLAAVPYPTLALIRGHCLGGGLELALACRYRLAIDEPGTSLALPEVMLGIFPGWGGMRRLPALIGP